MSTVTYLEDGPSVLSLYEGFFAGGARILHTAVVRALDATTPQRHSVLSLSDRVQREFTAQRISSDNSYRRLTSAGVPVRALRRTPSGPITTSQLKRVAQSVAKADVVLSLKEQPLTVLGRVGTSGTPLITCLHRSDPEHQGAGVQELIDLDRAGLLTAAVCCAESTQRAYHEATGIPLERLPVLPNGVDLYKFRTDAELRAGKRAELGVDGDAPVVMIAARFDEMKNIPLFVRAARRFVQEHPDAHLVMCGAGMTADNPAFAQLITDELGAWPALETNLHALGIQSQMAPLYNAADLITLTSAFGEAAPLCLLEGMACGAVPVTTPVGDAPAMVGDLRLVSSFDPAEMAESWKAAFAQREEHFERIFRNRQRLSEQRLFDAYARLIKDSADAALIPVAV